MEWNSLPLEQQDAARILWNFHKVGNFIPDSVDLMLVTGSHDIRVADYAAKLLYTRTVSPKHVAISGGFGKITKSRELSEAQRFAARMEELGVDCRQFIIESTATNSGENFTKTKSLMDSRRVSPSTGLVVTKPYMERRMLATGEQQWSDVQWLVTSPKIAIEDYPVEESPLSLMLNLMVGDLQRLDIYADKGFLKKQAIPDTVWEAFRVLRDAGFNQHVVER